MTIDDKFDDICHHKRVFMYPKTTARDVTSSKHPYFECKVCEDYKIDTACTNYRSPLYYSRREHGTK